jgi:hypothetical protein
MITRVDRLARSIGDLPDIVRAVPAEGASLKATEQPIDTAPQQASASSAWLFDTHISCRIGLPTVAGSSRRCRSSNTVGSVCVSDRRPPAGTPSLRLQGVTGITGLHRGQTPIGAPEDHFDSGQRQQWQRCH